MSGLLQKIKDKLKGKKSTQDNLEKAKGVAADAIDKAAAQANIDTTKTETAKKVVNEQIDKVKADMA